jgi:4-aminobutyrate aminotransferase-like enzyme
MAATKVIVDEDLPGNALAQGEFITKSMKSIIGKYPFVKDFRGIGLFTIIEYTLAYSGSIANITNKPRNS